MEIAASVQGAPLVRASGIGVAILRGCMRTSASSIGMGWTMSERVIGRYRAGAGGIMKLEVGEQRHDGRDGTSAHASAAVEPVNDRNPRAGDADGMDTNRSRVSPPVP